MKVPCDEIRSKVAECQRHQTDLPQDFEIAAEIDPAERSTLFNVIGRVNHDAFCGAEAGHVLLLRAVGMMADFSVAITFAYKSEAWNEPEIAEAITNADDWPYPPIDFGDVFQDDSATVKTWRDRPPLL